MTAPATPELLAAARRQELPVVVIRPRRGWAPINLIDLWTYRELIYFLVWRDLKVRYKQTLLGAGWGVLQPLLMMAVFSIFFARLTGIPSEGLPYPIFVYTALIPWTFFSYTLNHSSNSLVENAGLLRKVYFPRLAIPVASVLAGLADFAIGFGLLIVLMVYYGIVPTLSVLLLPLFILLAIGTSLSFGILFSALNLEYRDVRYTLPFLVQLWLLATPVAYPSSLIHQPWRSVYGLNPMAGVVEGFRWALLGAQPPSGLIAVSTAVTLFLLLAALVYFRRMEKTFADRV